MPTPVTIIPRIVAWSFSRWNDYNKCPAYAKYKHVDRIKEPGSEALDRGSAIHALAEKFAKATKKTKCPAELKTFVDEFRDLQARNVIVEEQWAFDKDWHPTGWFDKDCWARLVIDCHYLDKERNVIVIIDHKTGKVNEWHINQLSLYALGGLQWYPDCDGVEVQLWYLDHGVISPDPVKTYMRDEVKALQTEWAKKTKPMLADTRFAPKPSNACNWCHYGQRKTKLCKF
jgi:hypothetical protein